MLQHKHSSNAPAVCTTCLRKKERRQYGCHCQRLGRSGLTIVLRQSKHPNNIVARDHRAIKCITQPMLGFKTFRRARIIVTGIETMHTIRQGQVGNIKDEISSAANQFYSLAF